MYIPIYFTLSELCNSDTANRLGMFNAPTFSVVYNLSRLCETVLDVARKELNAPIKITSGYRCQSLNKAIGGSIKSQHIYGLAADIVCDDLPHLFDILSCNPHIDQLLYEHSNAGSTWLHVSISEEGVKPRNYMNRYYKAK